MEDMCQLTGKLTEDKYRGSYEQVAKAILSFSVNPVLDVVNFFEQLIFSFLTGNADMHLKNFSLIGQPGVGYTLASAYDMVATALINPADTEELALTLNGKKRKLKWEDFSSAFATFKLPPATQKSLFGFFSRQVQPWLSFIDDSFLPPGLKEGYKHLIQVKAKQIGIL